MWRLAWLVALGGCQLVFPFQPAGDDAGGDPDAAIDTPAPAACPDSGPPVFSVENIVISSGATNYSASLASGRAFAIVNGRFAEGPIDSDELDEVRLPVEAGISFEHPRLAPSGTELFVVARDDLGPSTIRMYRGARTTWGLEPNLSGLPTVPDEADALSISAPTTTARQIIAVVVTRNQVSELVELVNDNDDSWVLAQSYDSGSLGVLSFTSPSLSEDGLRLVVAGNAEANSPLRIFYTARERINDRFPPMQEITTQHQFPGHPYLTSDCSALYLVTMLSVVRLEP